MYHYVNKKMLKWLFMSKLFDYKHFLLDLNTFTHQPLKLRRKDLGGEVHIFNKRVSTRGVRALVTFFIRESHVLLLTELIAGENEF